jgi:N-acetylmuramoyl-L-alanine amidase
MCAALPFAAAADTQNIGKNNVNTNLNQNTVGTNAVTDNGLKIGATGDKVVELQNWLKNQGYYTGAIDGSFGPYTEQAVKYFQEDAGIVVDGWVSTQTENAMEKLTGTTLNLTTGDTTSNSQSSTTKTSEKTEPTQVATHTAKTSTSSTLTKTSTTSSNTVAAAKSKVTGKTTGKTISGQFKPTGAFDSGYAYKWYYVTWLNYDPSSGQWGVLEYNPKGADGGELTSSVTGVDYDGVSGYEKEYNPRWQLTKA